MIVEIETINRCNSTCEFCPANKDNDKRPFARLSDEDFRKIISDLKDWNYNGMISLYINNEPLIDTRILDFHKYVRQELPECRIKLFTNGNVGICCNDATEKTNLGNIREQSLQSIWETQCQEVRRKMEDGRYGMEFCKYCDTMDSGFRLKKIIKRTIGNNE